MNFNRHSKIIDDFPKYIVTDDGRIFNGKHHEMKQTVNRDGYSMVMLSDEGRRKNCSVHRLVAEAFIPNPENKRTVNHKDTNKMNNDVRNLEWNTHGENEKHAYDNKLRKSYLTDEHRKNGSKISGDISKRPVCVNEINKVYSSIRECAEQTGCDPGAISKCCNGIANKHHGYTFTFAE